MLKKILELFPSGIVLYSKSEGIFFKNKFWMDLLEKFTNEFRLKFWTSSDYVEKQLERTSLRKEVNQDVYTEDEITEDEATQVVLNSLYLRDNPKHSLVDEILKIHSHFYDSNVELNKIDEQGMDDFICRENLIFNEYEIKNVKGEQISAFSVRFSAFNFTQSEKSIMVVINDISERARFREAKISEMLKTVMLCSISHELRTPVNQINGVLTLLLPTLNTAEQKSLLRIANSSTELLKLKVDDMLDYYEIETRNFKPEMKEFNPSEILEQLKLIFSCVVNKSNVKLYFYIHENTPKKILQDRERINQILANMVSNSIKYTKSGMISIIIDWEDDKFDPKTGFIKFSVSDTGCGIQNKSKQNLFAFLSPKNIRDIQMDRK